MRIRFLPEAEAELLEAARWYREQSLGLDHEFMRCVDDALATIGRVPNLFPLLVKVQQGESLSLGMQWFMTSHVRRYHRHYGGSGHLWQGRYKSFVVEDDDHLLTVARYVEGNPVRASMVQSAADWAWSSHRERCAERRLAPQVPVSLVQGSAMLDPLPVSFSDDWTTFVDTPLSARDLAKVRKKIERKNAAGGL